MKRKMKWLYLILVITLMALIEKNMSYWPKSIFKVLLFLLLPCFFFQLNNSYQKIKIAKTAKYLSLAAVLSIILGYFILDHFIDYEPIRIQLKQMMGISKDNFFWIALYISFINAFIEEFFFRGVYYLEEGKQRNTFISASAFAIYHLAIMDRWLSLPFLMLATSALLLVGLLFNRLALENDSIYSSYFLHLVANLTLNTIAYFFIL